MASQARNKGALGRVALDFPSIHKALTHLWQLIHPIESADYKAWRHRFLRERLPLAFWLVVACLLTFIALNSYTYISEPQKYVQERLVSYGIIQAIYSTTLLSVLACLLLYRSRFGHRYPEAIFLGLSWSTTMVSQLLATYHGVANTDLIGWTLLFTAQATFIPVCWTLHLLSQLVPLGYFLVVNSVLGYFLGDTPVYAHLDIWLWLFWLCFVCDLAVYLYERLQRTEFESRRELRVFLHAVSHDLRNPVMGTSMVLQNLLNESSDGKVTVSTSMIERLLQGSDRQLNLINSLLEAHDSEVRGVILYQQPLELSTLVDSVLSDLEPILAKNHIFLTNHISPNLPLVYADSTQLWRVFSNLISNALKHNPDRISLILDAIAEGNMIRCSVQDNGVGIPPQQCQRIFQLYSRGSRARYMPGLGLGLYLCRQIINAHGGEIGVFSRLGEGSTFWFTLPVASSNSPDRF
jgi:signal transduction histidine kinase